MTAAAHDPADALVFVALGSNLGDRAGYLAAARAALDALPGTAIVSASDIEETAPLGPSGQGPYLNQVIALRTTLHPVALLNHLLTIERANGRVRGERWGPRTLDLDIVRYGDQHVCEPDLVIPHPQLENRDFWQREMEQVQARLPRPVMAARR
jgi:2-amino-4-hydroxy-6-hydroxymethyldihydropteridine diphosphokinase